MKKIIQTGNAPAPVGPYNQAIVANGMLYASGQIAINPATNALIEGDITAETQQVMKNLEAVLDAANSSFDKVVKCSIFMKSMEDYAAINAVYAQYFDEATAPAREAVEVANLPKYVNVEISLMALVS
ncbi:MAG: RidA family protein [Aureispira sp.]|nr:RidA family protein [Aureispira sp.]